MKRKPDNIIAIAIGSVIAVAYTIYAPLAIDATNGLFSKNPLTVSLFSGVISELCVDLTIISGISLLAFAMICICSRTPDKGIIGARIFSIAMLVMQVTCMILAAHSPAVNILPGVEPGAELKMIIHPVSALTTLICIAIIVLCFRVKTAKEEMKSQEIAK